MLDVPVNNRLELTWDLSHDLTVMVAVSGRSPVRVRNPQEPVLPPRTTLVFDPGETQWLDAHVSYIPESFSGLLFEVPGTYQSGVAGEVDASFGRCASDPLPIGTLRSSRPVRRRSGPSTFSMLFPMWTRSAPPPGHSDSNADPRDASADVETAGGGSGFSPGSIRVVCPGGRGAPASSICRRDSPGPADRRPIPDHLLADDALLMIAFALEKLGRMEEAEAAVRRAFLHYPESDRIRRRYSVYSSVLEPTLKPADPSSWMLFDPGRAPGIAEWNALIGFVRLDEAPQPAASTEGPPCRRPSTAEDARQHPARSRLGWE